MQVTVKKDNRTATRDVDVDALPAASLASVIRIGVRNLPDLGQDAWTIDTASGRLVVSVPLADVLSAGLANKVNDAHASITSTTHPDAEKRFEAALAAADKAIANLLAGRIGGGGGPRLDPVAREALRMARERAMAKLGKGAKAKAVSAEAKRLVAENPAYMHLAEKHIAEFRELGMTEEEILADIGEDQDEEDAA